ncbi:MAG: MaoC/PaaZ C-terminal domain-containing protein [Gemmatimonadales bacterium]
MKIRARVENQPGAHRAIVETDGRTRELSIPARAEGAGSAVSGGELLMLSLATGYCNEVHREAAKAGIPVGSLVVEAEGEFDGPGDPASGVRFRVDAVSPAPAARVTELLRRTDVLAEVQGTVRGSAPVTLEDVRVAAAAPAATGPLGHLVGRTAERSLTFTADSVASYAALTGDRNPLHFDPDFAGRTRFGRLVVHGGLTAGVLNALVAEDLPGPGTVFMSQELRYLAPVYVGDTITGRVGSLSAHPGSR